MRQVGDITGQRRADRFVAFLAHQGVTAEARADSDDRFRIWVMEEDQMAVAEEHYRAFRAAPEAKVFDAPKPVAKPAPKKPGAGRGRYIDVRTEVFGRGRAMAVPITLTLIALSIVLTLLSNIPSLNGLTRALYFSDYAGVGFPEILDGQVWRLITPIFLHAGILHLLFNMLWLYQLGGTIEINEGRIYYVAFILVTAALINSAQYLISGPLFLGMSGVVYATFGYVWMMSRYHIGGRYFIAQETVIIMLGWLVIGLVGLIPGVANTEHVGGLVVGVLWGYLRSGQIKTLVRRRRMKR